MNELRRASDRFFADLGGLRGYFLFSFAHYYDPENLGLGPLRALNEYTLAPRAALPLHPHTEVEIVSIVLEGAITYADAADNLRDVRAGQVARLTAGVGLQHAESNRGSVAAHVLELWFRPGQTGLQASQEQKAIDFQTPAGLWTPLVSGRGDGGGEAVFLNCDATVWWANLRPGPPLAYVADENRQLLAYVIAGEAVVDGQQLKAGDQLRMTPTSAVALACSTAAAVLLIDVGY